MSHYIHDHRLSEQKVALELWQSIIWSSPTDPSINAVQSRWWTIIVIMGNKHFTGWGLPPNLSGCDHTGL